MAEKTLYQKDETDGTWSTYCAGCEHYNAPDDDYAECGVGAGEPMGEWVSGKCLSASISLKSEKDLKNE